MGCPTCSSPRDLVAVEQNTLWCPNCGTITDRDQDGGDIPTQARNYVGLRAALRQIAAPDPHSPGWRQQRARAALDAAGGVGCDSTDPE
jgi:hypothetical protein